MTQRIEVERQASDVAYCDSLMNGMELLIKYSTAVLVVCRLNGEPM